MFKFLRDGCEDIMSLEDLEFKIRNCVKENFLDSEKFSSDLNNVLKNLVKEEVEKIIKDKFEEKMKELLERKYNWYYEDLKKRLKKFIEANARLIEDQTVNTVLSSETLEKIVEKINRYQVK